MITITVPYTFSHLKYSSIDCFLLLIGGDKPVQTFFELNTLSLKLNISHYQSANDHKLLIRQSAICLTDKQYTRKNHSFFFFAKKVPASVSISASHSDDTANSKGYKSYPVNREKPRYNRALPFYTRVSECERGKAKLNVKECGHNIDKYM